MVLKTIFPGCVVRASLILFLHDVVVLLTVFQYPEYRFVFICRAGDYKTHSVRVCVCYGVCVTLL